MNGAPAAMEAGRGGKGRLGGGAPAAGRAHAIRGAAKNGHLPIVKLLHGRGADANADRSARTPLILAAMHGHLNTVKYLVEKAGADKDAKDGGSERPRRNWPWRATTRWSSPPLDPEAAEKKGEELLQKMNTAKRVHVISTRYQKEESMMEQDKGNSHDEQSCDPFTRPTTRRIASRLAPTASSSSSTPTATMPF